MPKKDEITKAEALKFMQLAVKATQKNGVPKLVRPPGSDSGSSTSKKTP